MPIDAGGTVGPTGIVHPGILNDKASARLRQGEDRRRQGALALHAFNAAKAEPYAAPWATVLAAPAANGGPAATVECGSYSNPDVNCTAEKYDASAAYTSALLWYFTGESAYAQAAIDNMNAWSALLKQHADSNAPVQSGWVGEVFPRAAEIIRYSGAGWSDADAAQFSSMLTNAYLPYIQNGAPKENGNWELSMIDALMATGVFNDDASLVQKAATMWRARVPAYIYLTTDGPTPVLPPGGDYTASTLGAFWYGQTQLVDGVAQETCRDLGHVQYGFAAMINAAETARIQGIDLYGAEKARIVAGLEYHAAFLDGAAVPSFLCGGKLTAVTPDPMWEIAFNEYSARLGGSLPSTSTLVQKIRPTGVDHHMDWETLTHAEVGGSGQVPDPALRALHPASPRIGGRRGELLTDRGSTSGSRGCRPSGSRPRRTVRCRWS